MRMSLRGEETRQEAKEGLGLREYIPKVMRHTETRFTAKAYTTLFKFVCKMKHLNNEAQELYSFRESGLSSNLRMREENLPARWIGWILSQ
jgi:hypothetical protein